MSNDSIGRTLLVATGVCVVCSVLVSAAAVGLKPRQERNKRLDRTRNILLAAGLLDVDQQVDATELEALFRQIDARVIDLDTGEFVPGADAGEFDVRRAARDPETSRPIEADKDLAGIKRRPNHQVVYFVGSADSPSRIVLPVYGKGLWSTMWGLIALDRDLVTVKSFAFFEHGETPGLGGEVDRPSWKALWVGKEAFDADGNPCLEVVKGKVPPGSAAANHQVDGLSGATLTGRGVTRLLRFWLGDQGYGPFLEKLKARTRRKR